MDIPGMAFGFGAAAFQSFSYLGSRWFLQRSGGSPLHLLGLSHLLMGAAALLLFPLLLSPTMPPLRAYLWPALGSIGFYMIAQVGLFLALRRIDSSRVAPFLGLKIFILALVSAAFLSADLNGWQWSAVGVSVLAVFLLNESGGRIPAGAAWALALAVVGYSFSDLCIKQLVQALKPAGRWAALTGVCVTYIMGALAGFPLVLRGASRSPRLWLMALPYAAAWFISMLFLYMAFDRIGVIHGNIIQSTRGLISIGLGAWVGRALGMADLERQVPHGVMARRALGAVLMSLAIALYLKK